MNLWQLRTFKVVSRVLHFTRASEELNLSQPAVSHQIRSLEAEFGEALFVRGKQGISLTPAGSIVLEHADKIFMLVDKMRAEIAEANPSSSGAVSLTAALRFLENPFSQLYKVFKKTHPDTRLSFRHEQSASGVIENVLLKGVDIGFMATTEPDPEDFALIVLGKFKMMVVVGPDHRLANRASVDAKQLENEHWALFEEGDDLRGKIDFVFAEAGINPKSVYATNDGSVISDLVSGGDFVSILPSLGISRKIERGNLLIISCPELEFFLPVYVFWKTGHQSKAAFTFVQFLLNQNIPGIDREGIKETNED